jgi:hypothetical protein
MALGRHQEALTTPLRDGSIARGILEKRLCYLLHTEQLADPVAGVQCGSKHGANPTSVSARDATVTIYHSLTCPGDKKAQHSYRKFESGR